MIELTVDKAADGGQCVGRLDGRVVFVRGALPGEVVRAQVTAQNARFWRADVTEVVTASPHRVDPACPWFGTCGGCSWLHADPAEQVRIKAAVLGETLRRIGGIEWPVTVRSLGMQTGWRGRVRLHVDTRGTAGLFGVGSHDVVEIADCLQAAPSLRLPEILERTWPGTREVHVSTSEAGRSVVAGPQRLGPEEHRDTVLGRTFSRAVDGFWQAHVDAPRTLAGAVRALAEPVERVVELYAGVGLFGLTLLDVMPGASLTLVEGDRVAAGHARRNGAGAARVLAVDTRRWRAQGCDLLVLDPPRAGAGPQVVRTIVAARPRTVIYVSCDPATLARDLKAFVTSGYVVDHIEGFDLFPGTAHVETIVRLRRAS